jgi:hypothetical protein
MIRTTFENGINVDIDVLRQPPGTYRMARNAIQGREEHIGTLSNEPGFQRIFTSGEFDNAEVLNSVHIPGHGELVFMKDGSATYVVLIKSPSEYQLIASNIPLEDPVDAVVKFSRLNEPMVYFTSKDEPVRVINITTQAQRNLLAEYRVPQFAVEKLFNQGSLLTGRYFPVVRFFTDEIVTPWIRHPKPVDIGNMPGELTQNGIKISLTHDNVEGFKEVQFGMVAYYHDREEAFAFTRIPYQKVFVFDGSDPTEDLDVGEVLVHPVTFASGDYLEQKDGRLLVTGVKYHDEFNFQSYANQIQVNWSNQVQTNHDTVATFQRDEVYAVAVKLHYTDGRSSIPWHIPATNPNFAYQSDIDYPSTFDSSNYTGFNGKIKHHKTPNMTTAPLFNSSGQIYALKLQLSNIIIPPELAGKVHAVEVLVNDRTVSRRVLASGYAFRMIRERVSYTNWWRNEDKFTIAGPSHNFDRFPVLPYDGTEYTYNDTVDGLNKQTKFSLYPYMVGFMSPDTSYKRAALAANRANYGLGIRITPQWTTNAGVAETDMWKRQRFDVAATNSVILGGTISQAMFSLRYSDFDTEFQLPANFALGDDKMLDNRYNEQYVLLRLNGEFTTLGKDYLPYMTLVRDDSNLYGSIDDVRYVSVYAPTPYLSGTTITVDGDAHVGLWEFYLGNIRRNETNLRPEEEGTTLKEMSWVGSYRLPVESMTLSGGYREPIRKGDDRMPKTLFEYLRVLRQDFSPNELTVRLNDDFADPDNPTYVTTVGPLNTWLYNVMFDKGNEMRAGFGSYAELNLPKYFPNRTLASEVSLDEDRLDNYAVFLANNYGNVPLDKGLVRNTLVHNGQLYAHCEHGLWLIPTNPQVVRTNEANIYIGTGELFSIPPRDEAVSSKSFGGLRAHVDTVHNEHGYFWVDRVNGKVFRFGDGLEDLSRYGLYGAFQDTIDPSGIHRLAYDARFARILVSEAGNWTRSYSLISKAWVAEHDYLPDFYIGLPGREVLAFSQGVGVFRMNAGVPGRYISNYSSGAPSLFEVKAVMLAGEEIVWDALHFEMRSFHNGSYVNNDFFSRIRIANNHQNTDHIVMAPFTPVTINYNKKQAFFRKLKDGYNVKVPFNALDSSGVSVFDLPENTPEEVVSKEVMLKFRDRIKSRHITIELIYDNEDGYEMVLSSVSTSQVRMNQR